jgi:hypothetical protein
MDRSRQRRMDGLRLIHSAVRSGRRYHEATTVTCVALSRRLALRWRLVLGALCPAQGEERRCDRSQTSWSREADRLAELEVRDNGKLLTETRSQLDAAAECWYYYAGMADKLEGRSIPVGKPGVMAFTTQEPVGVVAAITAWNSPAMVHRCQVRPSPGGWLCGGGQAVGVRIGGIARVRGSRR